MTGVPSHIVLIIRCNVGKDTILAEVFFAFYAVFIVYIIYPVI